MSNYFKTNSLGATAAEHPWQWEGHGRCVDTRTGQKVDSSACYGREPSRADDALKYAKQQLLSAGGGIRQPSTAPSSSFTSSGLLVPAIAAVGGVALLLILTRKK